MTLLMSNVPEMSQKLLYYLFTCILIKKLATCHLLSKYKFKDHEKYKKIHKFFTPMCVKYDVTRHVMTL